MATMPSDAELEKEVRKALRVVNMEEVSLKVIRKQLEAKWQVDLSEKKAFLKELITAILMETRDEEQEEQQDDAEEEEEEEEEADVEEDDSGDEQQQQAEEEEEEEEEGEGGRAKAQRPKRTDYQPSPALHEFLGGTEEFVARGDVTKAVWAYIRENSLQDPKDGRKIRNDEKMFRVFKCKTMNMLQIAKKLSPHLKKYSDLVGSNSSSSGGGGGGGGEGSSKKRGATGARAAPTAKKATPSGAKTTNSPSSSASKKSRPKASSSSSSSPNAPTKKGARKPGGGVNNKKAGTGGGKGKKGKKEEKEDAPAVKRTRQPSRVMWRVSDELAAVVGSTEASVDGIRSAVHLYIKEHNLQDPSQRTMVICDPTLERVMGQKVVKMFGMQSLISPHRLHKL